MPHKRFGPVVLCALAVVALGCGKDANLPPLVPVTGTVTLNDQPLASATVEFIPIGKTRGSGATGYTDDQGKYELVTRRGDRGTPVGEYRVVVKKMVNPDGTPYSAKSGVAPMDSDAREVLPPRFSDDTQTKLKKTVPEGGGEVNLSLKSKP